MAFLALPVSAQATEPDITLGVTCLADQTARFTIANQGANMPTAGSYVVVLVDGTSTTTSFQLTAGQNISFGAAGDTRVDVTYSTSTLSSVFLTATAQCIQPTAVATVSTPVATETLGTPVATATLGTPVATETLGTPVATATLGTPVATATLGTPVATETLGTPVATETLGTPVATATLGTPIATATVIPADALLTLSVRCQADLSASFTITNEGGAMLTPAQYTLYTPDASEPVDFTLAAGESLPFTAPGFTRVDVIYSTQQLLVVFLSAQGTCLPIPDVTAVPDVTSTEVAITMTPEPTVSTWQPISMGDATCPDWLVYHTNMTGDWELFRLGDLADTAIKADANLSRGVGEEIIDIMPATSPDGKWIAFTSNRDGNWEIYLSAVEQDWIQRITYDVNAIDFDPVWSPSGSQLVYESTRNGNWNLYLFDVSTGLETQLTDDEADDVNAAWSHDGSKIVFETNRDGLWQVYDLNIQTLEAHQLSSGMGEDHEPQFSSDDQLILFRSTGNGTNSVISTMNATGGDVISISGDIGDALNAALSPDDTLIAYQSDVDGDNDIYVYEFATGLTRQLTDNTIEDYAPMWRCAASVVVFTSDVTSDANLFQAPALPIDAIAILVDSEAVQLTFDLATDQYSESALSKENASRGQNFPSPKTTD